MNRLHRLMVIGTAAILAACTAAPPAGEMATTRSTGATIVELESRFAATSRTHGARAAFLEFLADDSIVLQPGPVWGRAAWESNEDLPGTLDWSPDRAEISSDGDLGFSTGPWTLTPVKPGPIAEGRYLTVWKKLPAGWRVVFDGGYLRRRDSEPLVLGSGASIDQARCQGGPAILAGELQVKDLGLSGSASGAGYAERVLQRTVAGFAAFHAPDFEGARDLVAQQRVLSALPATTQLWPMGAEVAASGDIGFTYGLSAPATDASADASYVHIWCRAADGWRLLLELRTKLPSS